MTRDDWTGTLITEALTLYPVDEIPAGRARLELCQAGQPYRE